MLFLPFHFQLLNFQEDLNSDDLHFLEETLKEPDTEPISYRDSAPLNDTGIPEMDGSTLLATTKYTVRGDQYLRNLPVGPTNGDDLPPPTGTSTPRKPILSIKTVDPGTSLPVTSIPELPSQSEPPPKVAKVITDK